MENRTENRDLWTNSKNRILEQFKRGVSFYRMEQSENVIELFNIFGALLLHSLTGDTWMWDNRNLPSFSEENERKVRDRVSGRERHIWNNIIVDNRELITCYQEIIDYEFPRLTASVENQLFLVLQDFLECYREISDPEFLYDVMRGLLDLCINTKGAVMRYILPDEFVQQIMKLIYDAQAANRRKKPVRILDGEYGSGTMLLAVGKDLERAELFGYEQDKRFRMSANILSILARKPITTLGDNFLVSRKTGCFDFVLTNPLFQNDVVPEEVRREVLPQELWRVRGKHNLIVVRSLEELVENGWAAIVVPDSFLFSNKAETAFVRRWILNTYCVEGIVSLPPKMFYRNTATRASVLLISNPFMKVEWMNRKTPYLFFYQWGDEVEPGQAGEELREIWSKRDDYFKQWTSQIGRNPFGNVPVPGDWEFLNFWFADITTVANEKWNMLPRYYQPMERQELLFEDPRDLLQQMIQEQEELLRDMYALGAEVDRL